MIDLYINKPYLYQQPKKGDIIIFKSPKKANKEGLFIKRIVATSGDRFCIEDGILKINGIEIEEEYVCEDIYLDKDYQYTTGIVPKNKVFVMGDNRNNSNDSRRFCCIATEKIKGKVILRIWPLNKFHIFSNSFL